MQHGAGAHSQVLHAGGVRGAPCAGQHAHDHCASTGSSSAMNAPGAEPFIGCCALGAGQAKQKRTRVENGDQRDGHQDHSPAAVPKARLRQRRHALVCALAACRSTPEDGHDCSIPAAHLHYIEEDLPLRQDQGSGSAVRGSVVSAGCDSTERVGLA